MILVPILALFLGGALGVPAPPQCSVSVWSDWNKCTQESSSTSGNSFPVSDEAKAKGRGRANMKVLMDLKKKSFDKIHQCKSDESCKGKYEHPSITGARVPCVNGMSGNYPCMNVDMLAFLNFEDLGWENGNIGNDIWVWHDEQENHYYALMGVLTGISIVRVTDPVNPEVFGILRTHTTASSWRDIKVIGNHAYIVSEADEHGMQIFDLTQLRELEADSSREFRNTAHYDGIGNTHNIAANPATNTLYLIGGTKSPRNCPGQNSLGGLHILDVTDPENPDFKGCWDGDGYVHDTECLIYHGPDTEHVGKEICFGYNEESLTIYDLSDKRPGGEVRLSRMTYTGAWYTHQGWATEDHRFLLLDDELDESYGAIERTQTYVWNIEDLDNPFLMYTHFSTETAIDHNLYILNNYAHQSNYEAGYRILDLSNIEVELTEVGYFDVKPGQTEVEFSGAWSNYPWMYDLEGNQFTVVSSIELGLFIVQPDWAAIGAQSASGPKQSRHRDIVSTPDRSVCPHLSEERSC